MVGRRRYVPASEYCASVRDGTHDSPKRAEKGRKLVTSRHLTTGELDLSNAYLISEEDFENINKRSKVDTWDVLISMIGTVGVPCLMKEQTDFAIKNLGLFKTKSETDGKWLYYYLLSSEAQESIREQSRGSTQQYIPLASLKDLPVFVPHDREEQRAIVHILGTLDDKIELNRRMNETLEKMARALFKSWFVDFDPVYAKAALRTPPADGCDWTMERASAYLSGMDASIVDLFPDRLVGSVLGEIPVGWDCGEFGDVVRQSNERVGDRDATVLSAVSSGELVQSDRHFNKRVYSKSIRKYLAVNQWDIAYNPSRINIGSVGMYKDQLLGAVSPVYTVATPDSNYKWFLEFTLRMLQTKEWIRTLATGSVRQSLSYSDFASIPCVVPPPNVVSQFDREWNRLWQTQKAYAGEIGVLATLRETLLPKFMSGEVRISEWLRPSSRNLT